MPGDGAWQFFLLYHCRVGFRHPLVALLSRMSVVRCEASFGTVLYAQFSPLMHLTSCENCDI